ncbi:hypothetical protein L873DRAFT_1669773, partial [Choiromyces venosus 120613-1]
GFMRVTTANAFRRIPDLESQLTIDLGRYCNTGWFMYYDIFQYNIIFGKDWIVTVNYFVDHKNNILYLGLKDDG